MFDRRITFGNVLIIIMLLASAFASTATIVHNIDAISERVTVLEVRVTMLESVSTLLKKDK